MSVRCPIFQAAPGVIVLEQRPRWEAALKRNLSDSVIRIRGCRKSKDALELLEQMRDSVLVIDLSTGTEEALRLTEATCRRALASGILVIAAAVDAELEWPFRELGAHDFLLDTLRGEVLARMCSRISRRHQSQNG